MISATRRAILQDALIAERTLEGGSPYEMDLDDADVYRRVHAARLCRHASGSDTQRQSVLDSHVRNCAVTAVQAAGFLFGSKNKD